TKAARNLLLKQLDQEQRRQLIFMDRAELLDLLVLTNLDLPSAPSDPEIPFYPGCPVRAAAGTPPMLPSHASNRCALFRRWHDRRRGRRLRLRDLVAGAARSESPAF